MNESKINQLNWTIQRAHFENKKDPSRKLSQCPRFLVKYGPDSEVMRVHVQFFEFVLLSVRSSLILIPNLKLYDSYHISRLNSEDFLKFFLCSDILFQTFPYERADWEVRKNAKFFSNSREYSWFFRLFQGFSYKNFFVQWATVTCYVALDSP